MEPRHTSRTGVQSQWGHGCFSFLFFSFRFSISFKGENDLPCICLSKALSFINLDDATEPQPLENKRETGGGKEHGEAGNPARAGRLIGGATAHDNLGTEETENLGRGGKSRLSDN